MPLQNRQKAGKRLAAALAHFRDQRPIVLALPRGGVPVAAEIATSLAAPLDLVLVRKIGVPEQPEFAMGAVVDGIPPIILRNEPVIASLEISDREFEQVRDRELVEIERRRWAYVGGRPRIDVAGRVVILVDDGIATGMTMRAAARATAARAPSRIVVAVPVASADIAAELRREVDEVVCVEEHKRLFAIGSHYADFSEVSDETAREVAVPPFLRCGLRGQPQADRPAVAGQRAQSRRHSSQAQGAGAGEPGASPGQ
jgi:predicted phosphoribosyltransferase